MVPAEAGGEGIRQLAELTSAFVLSALIGLEREIRQKSAGLRTYTLVGVAAALFLLISKYGFGDVLSAGRIVVDPSRVAAQIVTGIGFLGAGVIFVRSDVVKGLTTAATIWLTTRHRHGVWCRTAVAGARGDGRLLHRFSALSVPAGVVAWESKARMTMSWRRVCRPRSLIGRAHPS